MRFKLVERNFRWEVQVGAWVGGAMSVQNGTVAREQLDTGCLQKIVRGGKRARKKKWRGLDGEKGTNHWG